MIHDDGDVIRFTKAIGEKRVIAYNGIVSSVSGAGYCVVNHYVFGRDGQKEARITHVFDYEISHNISRDCRELASL